MKIKILPQTITGRKSLYCFGISFVLGTLGSLVSAFIGNTIEYPNPFNSPLLGTIIYLTFILAGIGSFLGLKSIFIRGENSIIIFVFSIIGGVFFGVAVLMLVIGTFQTIF